MAQINPFQDYDIIHTLTFAEASGDCPIRLYRGSTSAYSGTVYYRAGTSGDWTSLSVSGTDTTFPVTSTTMQVAHNWDKLVNHHMTPSFYNAKTITSIAISQKSFLTGTMGNNFMVYYAYGCSSLTSLDVPDTSGLTSVGNYFMYSYAEGCSSLSSLTVPDTSGLTSVGTYFMRSYAYGCSSLTSLAVPDTSGLTSVGNYFMYSYAEGCSSLSSLTVPDTSGLTSVGDSFMNGYASSCSSLTELLLPAVGWFEDNNVNWNVPSGRLGILKGRVLNPNDLNGWKALTAEGKTLYTNYIQDPDLVYYEGVEPITLSGRSTTETRTVVKINTSITIAVKSITPTRTMLSVDVTAIIHCRSPTQARAGAELDTLVTLVGLISWTETRAIAKAILPYKLLDVCLSIQEREIGLSIQEQEIGLSIQEREVKLEVDKMPLIGDTVRLKAEFRGYDGELISPSNVKLKIYDGRRQQIGEDIPVESSEPGKYQHDYVIPAEGLGPIYFEFCGEFDGPVLGRAVLDRSWI